MHVVCVLVTVVIITGGVTYAFFNYTKRGTTENTVTTGTITFLKPFSNTSYTVTQGIRPSDSETTLGRIVTFQQTKYTDKILYTNNGWTTSYVGVYMDWYACGY